MAALEPIKDNEEAVKAYGIHLGTEMCKKILAHGIKTLHMYTLNMEKSAMAILMVILYLVSCIWIAYIIVDVNEEFSFVESWINWGV